MTLHLCGQVYREGKWDQLPGDAIVPGDLVSIGRPSGLLPACLGFRDQGLGFGVRGSGFGVQGDRSGFSAALAAAALWQSGQSGCNVAAAVAFAVCPGPWLQMCLRDS